MYKITDHPFVIRFIPQTTIAEVIENAPVINVEKFMLRSFDPLQALANTNLELPGLLKLTFAIYCIMSSYICEQNILINFFYHIADVVGQIQYVQGSDLHDATVTTRVVIRFLIEPYVILLTFLGLFILA